MKRFENEVAAVQKHFSWRDIGYIRNARASPPVSSGALGAEWRLITGDGRMSRLQQVSRETSLKKFKNFPKDA
jgi:hypothetical protein